MAKTKISEFSSTPGSNTDIDGINIAEGCAPSGINDAIRELMSQLKDFQTGAQGDSFNGPVGTTTAAAGAFTTLSASGAVTLSGGTANGVAYLNGSKVVTTGSALTFDGTNLSSTGGATFQGSPTGYSGGEVRLGSTTADIQSSVSTQATGSPILFFDHRGTGNTGIFAWRNGSGGGSELMRLTTTGLGIGTSSPAAKLDVTQSSSGSVVTALMLRNPNSTVAGTGTKIYFSSVPGNNRGSYIESANTTSGNDTYLAFGTNSTGADATERMRIDSSGNLGLGVTPSAFDSPWRALQITPGAGYNAPSILACAYDSTYLLSNAVYASGFKYIANNYATQYQQYQGQHRWHTAPSGTAGNTITFTQAMTLDASGNLGIGTSSPGSILDIVGSGDPTLTLRGSAGAYTAILKLQAAGGGSSVINATGASSDNLQLQITGTTKATLDSSGNLGLGVTPSAWDTTYKALQISSRSMVFGAGNETCLANNAYFNGGYKYVQTNSAGLYIMDRAQHAWYTAPSGTAGDAITFTQAMTLDASGRLLVGATSTYSNASRATIQGQQTGGGDGVVAIYNDQATSADASPPLVLYKAMTTTSSSARFVQFYAGGTATAMGGIVGNGASNVQFASLSDAREKTNIAPISGSLEKIVALNPVAFDWIANGEHCPAGFVAQDVEQVFPEFVVENMANDGQESRKGLTGGMTGGIVAHLVKAIQELKAEFDAYKASHP